MFFYFKKVIGVLLLCSLFMGTIPARTVQAEDAQPDLLTQEAVTATTEAEPSLPLYATAAVLMDGDTGRVLYEKNGKVFFFYGKQNVKQGTVHSCQGNILAF